DQVASERHLQAAGHREALDRRDQWLHGRPLDDPGEPAIPRVWPFSGDERLEIHPRAEPLPGPGDHSHRQLPVLVELVESGGDALGHGGVDGVALVRPVDRDLEDAVVSLGEYCLPVAHAANSLRSCSRSPRRTWRSTCTQSIPRACASTRACGLTVFAATTPLHRAKAR